MKRYIEIVYDNSSSMDGLIGGRKKYEIAQELFEKEILPTIGLSQDQVVLRLLRRNCNTASRKEVLPNQRDFMLSRIKTISHDQSTPLFHTVLDAVNACKSTAADEHLIFVLTDGDDTCGVKIEELIDQETLKKYVKFYKVLLVQLAVESPISRNNLTAFTTILGGRTIALDGSDSLMQMRYQLNKALTISGFSNQLPLDHCFESLSPKNSTWEEIEGSGMGFHQSVLLYQKGFITFMPVWNVAVNSMQMAELKFVYSLVYKSAMPEDLVCTMLSQLKKPYYYSFDCIFWDFEAARWKYFIPQNKIEQLPNAEAQWLDFPEQWMKIDEVLQVNNDTRNEVVESLVYEVRELNPINEMYLEKKPLVSFELVPLPSADFAKLPKTKVLQGGDRIGFKRS